MADKPAVVDYYAVMNLPYSADLHGVENAYARLSGELATMGASDDACTEALASLNEAYNVLSRADLRRSYDSVFLARHRDAEGRAMRADYRAVALKQWAISFALLGIVAVEGAFLVYIGWADLGRLFDKF